MPAVSLPEEFSKRHAKAKAHVLIYAHAEEQAQEDQLFENVTSDQNAVHKVKLDFQKLRQLRLAQAETTLRTSIE